MPAHLRPIVWPCDWPGCGVRASVQLYSTRNEPLGRYCKAHGSKALRDRLAREERG